ncbi:MAG TPA: hypothetical protein PLP29_18530 [Candidatus Ozemobacteraceae bacterium]|nr:hypothetical protein [Candidatus Ozemobacteraceae bacterium]
MAQEARSALGWAALGVGGVYLAMGGLMTIHVLIRGESPYLLPALWGGTGVLFVPLSAVVLLLARSRPLSATEQFLAQLPLLVFALSALLAVVSIGLYGISTD